MIRHWSLQDKRQSLVLASLDNLLPEIIYWGPRLPDQEDLGTLVSAHIMDVTGGMLDENPELSICPLTSRTFPGQSGISLSSTDGTRIDPEFTFENTDQTDNHLKFTYQDRDQGLTYSAIFSIEPETHMIIAHSELDSEKPVTLNWLAAPVFPAPQNSDEFMDFSGRWCGEFQTNHIPWSPGIHMRENRTGRTGHEHFPGLIIPCSGSTNTKGQAYAFHYGWSGGHRMIAEELPDGRRQIQFGNASNTEINPARHFSTAQLFATFSDNGINDCATSFQRHLREKIVRFPKPDKPRPVHYNCWEAVYFNHDIDELKNIASRAAKLGAERFVLDDGWFKNRNDDTKALSDWEVDQNKYPNGLGPLIDHIHSEGMTFGIWFEPEMINPDSDTFRTHPDWILGDQNQIKGRHQWVLNMTLPAVKDYLFDRISSILETCEVEYIKWDHNRVLPLPDAAQTRGTYELLERIRTAFPDIEIESCASGGGRIDFGIMKHTLRVWLSDSNDPLERLRIQHNAALFLPSVVTGSHVGPHHCHTSGRTTDIRLRAWVAAQRHMGFEMDPRELSDEEAKVLTDITKWWKNNREWMSNADILRLDCSDPAVIAEQQLSGDRNRFVVFAGITETSSQILPRPLTLANLDPDATYRIELVNREDAPKLSRGNPALKSGPVELSGQALMNHGLNLPWQFPLNMWVIEGTRL